LLGVGARLLRASASATLVTDDRLADPVRAVFEWRGLVLAVGRAGRIWARGVAGEAREWASFGAPVSAVLLSNERLYALSNHELLELELATKQRRTRFVEPSLELRELAAVTSGHFTLLAPHALLELDATGRELSRRTLVQNPGAGEASGLIVDADGTAAITASRAPFTLAGAQGDEHSFDAVSCPEPLRPTPLADGELVAGCRSGALFGLSDRAP
jgi:hypothetical protein